MDIVLLDYLLRLFALIANLYPYVLTENIKDFLKTSILKELSPQIMAESLRLFNEYHSEYSSIKDSPDHQYTLQSLFQTIQEIDRDISTKQRFLILLRLLLFEKNILRYPIEKDKNVLDFTQVLSFLVENFRINPQEYLNCRGFISNKLYMVPDKRKLLVIGNKKSFDLDIVFLHKENFPGQLYFFYIESTNTLLFNYKGSHTLFYNNQLVFSDHVYFFTKGTSLKGESFEPIYYNQVLQRFLVNQNVNLNVNVKNVDFRFHKSNNGIHNLSINLVSEQLIGIIGRSGVGKSTLINLLIGNVKPQQGSITINGLDLHHDSEKLDGLIGYVPQDDLLIEELSVFTNLFLNAQLCFDNLSPQALLEKVNNILVDLDLYEARDLKVGSPLSRYISGGQRKKLNIALELIREPWILFADEPTSGLSSSDSEEIMQLLSEQSSKGRIVVINIHQPSSDIFKLFDKIIVLDKEGYPVYFGNPLDALSYFNDFNQRISTSADYCNICENVNPEAIFKILEEKKTNQFGEYTKDRKTAPAEWHKYFVEKNNNHKKAETQPAVLPKVEFNKPDSFKQFIIFGKRNLLSKLANLQYMSMALLISPLLAALLATLCRFNSPGENISPYVFALNDNIPSYLFMSVIVALFVGLIISAEEIIRDSKILLRESYLKLSKFSYLNSKVVYLFALSALQSMLYVVIGNSILEIHGMTLYFWIILFSTSCFANMLGLLISSVFTTVVAIYITVPLIIVPQILLSGVVVNYDKLNRIVSEKEFVPVVGDIMASRWAYEALIVTQFSRNDFQKHYFNVEKQESNTKFNLLFILPEAKNGIQELKALNNNSIKYKNNWALLNDEINILKQTDYSRELSNIVIKPENFQLIERKLDVLNDLLPEMLNKFSQSKDSITRELVTKFGDVNRYLEFKNRYYNNSLADLVLKRKELESFIKSDNSIIRKMEPIYQLPGSKTGRAHFLSSEKRIDGLTISTLKFNLFAIWLMTVFLYGFLIIFSKFNSRFK
jgi:ABC-type multidrug transport system ATPase subunit